MINYVKLTVPRWQMHQRIWSGRIEQLYISMVLPPCIFFLCVTRFTHSVCLLQIVLTMLFIKAKMCPGVRFSSSWSIFYNSHLRFSPLSAIVCSVMVYYWTDTESSSFASRCTVETIKFDTLGLLLCCFILMLENLRLAQQPARFLKDHTKDGSHVAVWSDCGHIWPYKTLNESCICEPLRPEKKRAVITNYRNW